MDNKVPVRSESKKVTFDVVETEVVTESKPPLPDASPSSSKPQLTIVTSSIDSPSLRYATTGSGNLSVPSRDTSWAAWRVLCGSILVFGVLFAFPLAFGVFQNFLTKDQKHFDAAESIWIGVLSTGLPYIGAPFMTVLFDKYPQMVWRHYVIIGWAICATSLIAAAFCKSLLALAITQGVLYGVGLLILNVPVLLILNTWFVKRRGTAYGLLFGTCDLLGFATTILAEYLLYKHGLKIGLLTFGGIMLAISGPAIWLLQARPIKDATPATPIMRDPELEDMAMTPLIRRASSNLWASHNRQPYYRRPIFYIFALANLFYSLAYYPPFMYLPSYTTDLGYSTTRGAWLLAASNIAMIFGEIGFGKLSDRFNVHILILIVSLVSSIAAVTLWGLAHSFIMLVCFAIIFGSIGSGLIALWARMGTFFSQKDAQMVYSFMSFGRGLGSIVSGPISTALLKNAYRGSPDDGSGGYGNGKYFGVVLFVGVAMAISALMGVVGFISGWQKNELGRVDRKQRRLKPTPSLNMEA